MRYFITFCLSFLLVQTNIFSQEAEPFFPKGTTMEEAKEILLWQINEYDSIKYLDIDNISPEIHIAQIEEDEETRNRMIERYPPLYNTHIYDTVLLYNKLKEYQKGAYFIQTIENEELPFLLDNKNGYPNDLYNSISGNITLTHIINRVYYTNGTIENHTDDVTEPSQNLPIDSVLVTYRFIYHHNVEKIVLSPEQTSMDTPLGKAYLLKMINNSVKVLMPVALDFNIRSADGITMDNQKIRYFTRNIFSYIDKQIYLYYVKMNDIFKELVSNIDTGKYQTVLELDNDLFERFSVLSPMPSNEGRILQWNFLLNIKAIHIYYFTPEEKCIEYQMMVTPG